MQSKVWLRPNILDGMRVVVFGLHVIFLTQLEEYLQRKDYGSVNIAKNISYENKLKIVELFNKDFKYKACLVDYSQELEGLEIDPETPLTLIFGEMHWMSAIVECAERIVTRKKVNIIYVYGKYTLD